MILQMAYFYTVTLSKRQFTGHELKEHCKQYSVIDRQNNFPSKSTILPDTTKMKKRGPKTAIERFHSRGQHI